MKIAVLSSPMTFQTQGGLQIQILETIEALKRLGVDAKLIDPNRQMLKDFDLVHVFSAINGNHRIVECARSFGVPVITSPLIQPHWTEKFGKKARLIESVVGKMTQWEMKTEYRHIESCLCNSDHLIALGDVERESIRAAFRVPVEKISVIPNGVPGRFFEAKADLIERQKGMQPGFVLNVAAINSHKNQLMLAKASESRKRPVVLVGECLPPERGYLDQCLSYSNVGYLGKLAYEDALLPSAYAAASVFCLPSQSEVMPLSILESLAAGTPVVTTKNHSMNLDGFEHVLREVDPNNEHVIADAIDYFVKNPPTADDCRATVKNFTWDAVATAILRCYERILGNQSLKV